MPTKRLLIAAAGATVAAGLFALVWLETPQDAPAVDLSGIWLVSETVSETVSAECAEFAGQRLEYPVRLTRGDKGLELELFAPADRTVHRLHTSLQASREARPQFGWEGGYPLTKRAQLGTRTLRADNFALSVDERCQNMSGTVVWSWQRSGDSALTCSALLSRLELRRIGPGECSGAKDVTYEQEPNSRTPPPNYAAAMSVAGGSRIVGTMIGQTTLSVEGDDHIDLFMLSVPEPRAVEVLLQLDAPALVALQLLRRDGTDTQVLVSTDTAGGRGARIATPQLEAGTLYYLQLHALDTGGHAVGYGLTLD